jgi:GNAT superfamily N-acetyltransferase
VFKRPVIEIDVFDVPKELKETYWKMFKKHHYLGDKLNKSARCWVGYLWDNPVVFNSVLAMPSGSLKHAWREHRLVVLSDYQGMGIGNRMSECVGKILRLENKRFFSKTANIKLGEYRNQQSMWRPTSKNGKARLDNIGREKNYNNMIKESLSRRVCYSHEYMGEG